MEDVMSELDIRNQMASVLHGFATINDLNFWLADKEWSSDGLAADVEFLLAQYSSKAIARDELLAKLRSLHPVA
jgi:hypothetical protein